MAVEVKIPPVLRKYTAGSPMVAASGDTIVELLRDLEANWPELQGQVINEHGETHRFINIYRNGEDIRYLERLNTTIEDGDVVAILPAVAGGSS
jgi:MoaD family protein